MEDTFDVEKVMAEIKVAAPEFIPFLAWVAENTTEDESELEEAFIPEEFQTIAEAIYSYSRGKNEDEEERMMDGRS